jgi:hypothetical protein
VQVSWFGLETKVEGFPSLCLQTGSSGLVIWAAKSPRRFVGWGLKTKRTIVYQLHHKNDGRRMARDTH